MIKINRVSGLVKMDNRSGGACIAPSAGVTMPSAGADFVIVTGINGLAEIDFDGHYILVEENSCLHVRPDSRSFLRKHNEKIFGPGGWKTAIGRIWDTIERNVGPESGEEYPRSNAVIGVRG